VTELFNRAELKQRRKDLRNRSTYAEKILWQALRLSSLENVKFRRQASIGAFVVDFYAPTLRLAIELDGSSHDSEEARVLDRQRQSLLEEYGIQFLRFRNEEVLSSAESVVDRIRSKIQELSTPPPPPLLVKEGASNTRRPHITIYTDGACSGNPGPGGYAAVLLDGAGRRRELSGGFRHTTNNRMELLGVITALEALKRPCDVTLISDSEYIINAITKGWLANWQKKGWRKADKKPVMNIDLWQRLLPLLQEHNVEFKWTKGHAGNPENERCDELAVAASLLPNLPVDTRATPE